MEQRPLGVERVPHPRVLLWVCLCPAQVLESWDLQPLRWELFSPLVLKLESQVGSWPVECYPRYQHRADHSAHPWPL